MSMRRITCKGGPLHGKRYDVPVGLREFRATGGSYTVSDRQATWTADKAKDEAKSNA